MENLHDKIQKKWLENSFTSNMDDHPEEWDNIGGSLAIKSQVYAPWVFLQQIRCVKLGEWKCYEGQTWSVFLTWTFEMPWISLMSREIVVADDVSTFA